MIQMFLLRPTKEARKKVCPTCALRGEVLDACPTCHGKATINYSVFQFIVKKNPITITHIDRDPGTGILRYWENSCEFFNETVDPSLNPYIPEVPYGVHLCHSTLESAQKECKRINSFLEKEAKTKNTKAIKFAF